jgi:hypothetical protein
MAPEAQIRNTKLKGFVEEALDAGLHYERDLQDRIIPQILPFDEAVEVLIGTFTNPSFQDIRDLEKQVGELPRGSWAIVHQKWETGGCFTVKFSDGTGKIATGSAHDTYASAPSYAEVHRRVLGYEIYTMRHKVEAEREIAADLKAVADNRFELYQKFDGLKFDQRIYTSAQISEIQPNGHVVLRLTLRGSRKQYQATVGAQVLARRIREAEERAQPKPPSPEPVGQTALFLT